MKMNRAELEKQARAKGIEVDGRWNDERLRKEIEKAPGEEKTEKEKLEEGIAAQNSTPEQTGARFAEPQGEERFVPVDDEEAEFKKDAKLDKIKTPTKPKVKLFPVKLLKNYRPISGEAQIQGDNGEYRPLSGDEAAKVPAGSHVALPVEEAQSVIKNKIAERNDPIA
jgi:hypothetical protein